MMPRLCTCRDRASSRGGLVSICKFSVTHNLVRFCIRGLNIPTQRPWTDDFPDRQPPDSARGRPLTWSLFRGPAP
jgi:hypothetical protein